MSDFLEYPKISRLSRPCVVSEKIDGTNAQIHIAAFSTSDPHETGNLVTTVDDLAIYAGSRNRWLQPGKTDNFGFAAWVQEHAQELVGLGQGRHFGEWWGSGIQRGYGLTNGDKRFSLFNVARWADDRDREKYPGDRPACCHVVPVLYAGLFETDAIEGALFALRGRGSSAAPGFMKPEGVVVFHAASGTLFKKTLEKDEEHKGGNR